VTGDIVVVDSSALVAVFKSEADGILLAERVISYKRRVMSAATWLEAAMVCESAQRHGGADFAEMVASLDIEIVSFSPEQAQLALDAFRRFGKGKERKASLNYGDCFVYALAKELDAPLLFKGDDFAQTDIKPA
jgi:ribonuclease VapC